MTFAGARPPVRLNLARYCLSGKPAEKTALIVAGAATQRWSYAGLEDVVLRLAEGLRREGLEPGARLFIRMGNSLDYALMFFAANAIGAVPIAASPMLTPREVAALITFSGARLMAWDGLLTLPEMEGVSILTPETIGRLKGTPAGSYADTGADDPGYMIFTSGTSGTPKGVLHAQRAIWGGGQCMRDGTASAPRTSCSTPAPSTGPIRWARACSIPLPMAAPRLSTRARKMTTFGNVSLPNTV
ncbi:MAG: class I adenylate-forming enzyme family protein [Aestuariivirga sp.]|uniref:class I adenylate-forming enzyme family protein n=1 Tax=Aestuariivirga sp. TaxID=2650926 RepID=UPI003017FDAA